MANATPSYYLSWGMISLPLKSYPAARDVRVPLKNLHTACGHTINQVNRCATCDKLLSKADLAKGYEVSKGQFVRIEQNEIDELEAESNKTMEVKGFVPAGSVDPIYFGPTNFVGPMEQSGARAFALLQAAMKKTGQDAIVQYVQSHREKVGLLRLIPGKALMLHELFYANEVRTWEEQAKANFDVKVDDKELKLAVQLVEAGETEFDINDYEDTFSAKLNAVIQAKINNTEAPKRGEPKQAAGVLDLMAALKKSIEAPKKEKVKKEKRANG